MTRPIVVLAVTPELREPFFGRGQLDRITAVAEVRIPDDPTHLRPADLADAEVLVTGWGTAPLTPELLASAPSLRALVHSAGTLRGVLDPACYQRPGFVASNQADTNAEPVVEYTMALVVLMLKNALGVRESYRAQRRRLERAELEGAGIGVPYRRVGVVGASRIGRGVIPRLRALDIEVGLFDPYVDAAEAESLGVRLFGELRELAAWSELFSVHAPWLPSTENLVNAEVLAALPDGAHLINTARGAIIDEAALIAELQTGRIDAALDVTWPEPPGHDSPLWDLPNVFLTPHLAGSLGTEWSLLGRGATDEVLRVLAGDPLQHGVDEAEFERQA